MRYSNILDVDVVNGIGVACSLFTQGCPHHCHNCFNSETWRMDGGKKWTLEIENHFIDLCKSSYIDCISILGGDPLIYPYDLKQLLKRLKNDIKKPILVWTGYTYEELTKEQKQCLKYIDILIDGKYMEEYRDITLRLRGSTNQRIIDVQKTLKQHKLILYES